MWRVGYTVHVGLVRELLINYSKQFRIYGPWVRIPISLWPWFMDFVLFQRLYPSILQRWGLLVSWERDKYKINRATSPRRERARLDKARGAVCTGCYPLSPLLLRV